MEIVGSISRSVDFLWNPYPELNASNFLHYHFFNCLLSRSVSMYKLPSVLSGSGLYSSFSPTVRLRLVQASSDDWPPVLFFRSWNCSIGVWVSEDACHRPRRNVTEEGVRNCNLYINSNIVIPSILPRCVPHNKNSCLLSVWQNALSTSSLHTWSLWD